MKIFGMKVVFDKKEILMNFFFGESGFDELALQYWDELYLTDDNG